MLGLGFLEAHRHEIAGCVLLAIQKSVLPKLSCICVNSDSIEYQYI